MSVSVNSVLAKSEFRMGSKAPCIQRAAIIPDSPPQLTPKQALTVLLSLTSPPP